jgi:hypothetical protein
MIIVRLLSPEPVGWFCHHQLYSGIGADIVMESISLTILIQTRQETEITLRDFGLRRRPPYANVALI